MHYLGSDIRGKYPAELAFGRKAGRAGRRLVRRDPLGTRSGDDPARDRREGDRPSPPTDRKRPMILHAPSSRRRKGTEDVHRRLRGARGRPRPRRGPPPRRGVRALPRGRHRRRPAERGWYGLFAIECMALGKPVVTFLHAEAVARTEKELGDARADRERDERDAARAARAARRHRSRAAPDRRGVASVRRAGARPRTRHRPPARLSYSSACPRETCWSRRRDAGSVHIRERTRPKTPLTAAAPHRAWPGIAIGAS